MKALIKQGTAISYGNHVNHRIVISVRHFECNHDSLTYERSVTCMLYSIWNYTNDRLYCTISIKKKIIVIRCWANTMCVCIWCIYASNFLFSLTIISICEYHILILLCKKKSAQYFNPYNRHLKVEESM